MIKVAALTSGINTPSSRFRVRQHISTLKNHGVDVTEYVPSIEKYALYPKPLRTFGISGLLKTSARLPGIMASWSSEITWLERDLVPGYLTLEPLLKRPFILDVDDAVWTIPPRGSSVAAYTARRAAAIMAGNRYIADWFSRHSDRIHIVPTAIDTTRFMPGYDRAGERGEQFVIGWSGLWSNLEYLYRIEDALIRFLRDHQRAELCIIADKPPKFKEIPADRLRYVPWSPETEAVALQGVDVGIMPLPDTEFARGKCSFKMLQYMATELVTVVSPIGMNRDILETDEVGFAATSSDQWYEALSYLYRNPELRMKMGKTGRAVVEARYSLDMVSATIANIFKMVHEAR